MPRNALADLWLSPLVVMSRMPIIAMEAMHPDPRHRAETYLMVAEKWAAAQEGAVAAQMALGAAVAENMAAMAFGQKPRSTMRKTADAMMRAGLAPAAKRVRANVRRLGKR